MTDAQRNSLEAAFLKFKEAHQGSLNQLPPEQHTDAVALLRLCWWEAVSRASELQS